MSERKALLSKITALEEELNNVYKQLEQEKMDMFNSIVETTPNFIAIIQEEKFVFVNSTGLTLLQCQNLNDIKERSIYDIFHPDLHTIIKERLRNLTGNNANTPLHVKLLKTNGEYIDLETSPAPFIYNNAPAGLIAGRDITSELLHKQKLEDEKNLREGVLNSFPELIAFYEPNCKIRWMNDAAKKQYGINDSSYIGKDCYRVKFNADRPCENCPMHSNTVGSDERIVHDRGTTWQIRHTPILNSQGEITGYSELSVDVTEKEKRRAEFREAEKKLKESEQRFREIFENSHESIFLLEVTDDNRFRNLDCNPAFEKSTGIKCSDLIGKYTDETVPSETSQKTNEAYYKCVKERKAILDKEIELSLPSGTRTYMSSIIPIPDLNGKIHRILGITRDITEQKQMGEALAKREREFRTLAENAPDPIYRYDRQCRRIYINPVVEKVGKIPISSLLGKTPAEGGIVSPEESQKVLQSLQKVLKTGKRDVIDVLFVFPDGRELWTQNIHVPEFGPDGTVESVLSIGRDITERKLYERHLKDSFDFIEKIINSIPEPIFIKDRQHRFIFSNDAHCKFRGLTHEELIGKTDFDLFPEKEAKSFREDEEIIFETGKETQYDDYLADVEGRRMFIVLRKVCFTGADGNKYLAGTIHDITERKKAEEKLHQREQEFRTLVENSPDTIVRYDTNCNRVYFNPAFQKLADLRASDLIGTNPVQLSPLSNDQALIYLDTIKRTIDTSLPQSMELHMLNSDSELWYNMKAVPEFDKDGKVASVLAVARDVTELKKTKQMSEMLGFALNNASDAVFICEAQTVNFTYINDQACRSLGYSKEELLGMTIFDIDPDITPEILKQIDFDLTSRTSSVVESRHKTKEGKIFPVEVTNTLYEYNGKLYVMNIVQDITERKLAEKALQEERNLFIGGPNVAFVWRAEDSWPVEYASPNLSDQFGYKPEDLTSGKISFASIVHPDDLQRVANEVEHYCKEGDPFYEQEYRIARADGEYRWIYDFTIVVRDFNNKITHFKGYITDITSRKQAEIALRENEEKFSSVFKLSPASLSITRLKDNVFIDVNDVFLEHTGLSRDEVVGHNQYTVDLGIDINSFEQLREPTNENGGIQNFEYTYTNKQGLNEYGLLSLAIITIGGEQCVLSQSVRITKLKEAEKMLRQREQEYRTLVENSPDIITRFDLNYKRLYVNQAYLKISNRSKEEIIGSTLEELSSFPPYAAMLIQDLLSKVISSAIPGAIDLLLPGANHDLWFNIRAVPEFDSNGKTESVMTISRDITELKKKQNELIEAGKQLQVSEQRYREMFNNSHDSIYLLEVLEGGHFRLLDVNQQYEKEVGIDRKRHLGHTMEENVAPEIAAIVNAKYQRCVEAGTIIKEILELPMPQGTRIYHSSLVPIHNKSGKIYRIMGITRDVTEEVKAKQALEISQRRLSKAEFVAQIGHIEYDFVHDINYWSDGAYEIFNAPAELRRPGHEGFLEVIHPDDTERVRNALEIAGKELTKFDEVYRITDFNGNKKIIHASGQVQLDKNGTPGNFFGIIQDITLMHKLNAQLFAEEEKFRMLAEYSPVGIYISKDETPVYANKHMLDILCVDSIASLANNNMIDLVHPEDKVEVRLLAEKLKKEGTFKTPYKLSLRKLSEDQSIRHYNIHVTTFNIHNVKHLQFIVVDKTEEYENEKIRQQLVASSLYIDQKSKFISDIESNLKIILSSSSKFDKVDFQPIVDILRSYSHTDKDWEVLNSHIENIHPEFVANLKKHCATLSVNDIKHCSCIRLNLDTKEIARFFNVKPSSIQTSRVRLKKKFQLDESTDLREFILGL